MASLSIHGLDEDVAALLKARARAEKVSLNVLVKRLLAQALGVKPAGSKHQKAFERFCGGWSKEQAASFGKAVKSLETGATLLTFDAHFAQVKGLRRWPGA